MPIANCYINQLTISREQTEQLTRDWSIATGADMKDICLSFIDVSLQAGQTYKVMVNLFLPSLWPQQDAERIQLSLDRLLKEHFGLDENDVFIITTTVASGMVTERGQIVRWT